MNSTDTHRAPPALARRGVPVRGLLRPLLGAEPAPDPAVRAAIGDAASFATWQSLVREQELGDAEAVALMVTLVGSAADARSR